MSRSCNRVFTFKSLLFALGLISIQGPLLGQNEPKVFENLDVRLQQIQVNVTRKNGSPVKALSKSDFSVYLAGKKQTIMDVSEVSLGQDANTSDQNVSELGRRLYIFFYDLRYTTRLGLLNARKSTAQFLKTNFLDKDLGLVTTFHPDQGIQTLCNVTGDIEVLNQAIDTLGLVNSTQRGRAGYFNQSFISRNSANLNQVGSMITALSSSISSGNAGPGASEQLEFLQYDQEVLEQIADILQRNKKAEEDVYRSEVNRFLLQFRAFANAIKQIRGRKNLVWFSSGFDEKVLTGNSSAQIQDDSEAISRGEIWNVSTDATGNTGIQSNLSDAVAMLQGSNTMVFAVDTSLNENKTGGQSGVQSLNAFSKDTGGQLFRNGNNLLEPLKSISQITSHYYLITFEPSAGIDKQKPQKLRIKTSQKGITIHANRTLTLESDFSKLSPIEKQFQISEFLARDIVSNEIPIQMTTYNLPGQSGLNKVLVSAEIPKSYYAKMTQDLGMEVFIHAIRTPEGILFDANYYRFQLKKKSLNKNPKSKGIQYLSDLFLAPGQYRLKVVVRNLKTGSVGSTLQDLTVAPLEKGLSGPYLITNEPSIVVRPDETSQKEQRGADLNFGYPFLVEGNVQLPGNPEDISLAKRYGFYYVLDRDVDQAYTQKPNMRAFLMGDDQKPIQIPREAISAGSHLQSKAPFHAGMLIYIDFSKLNLDAGKQYQLFSEFMFPGEKPNRHIHKLNMVP